MIPYLRVCLNAPNPGTLKAAVPDADHSGRMPRLTVARSPDLLALAGCAETPAPRAQAPTPTPVPAARRAAGHRPPEDRGLRRRCWRASGARGGAAARRDRARAPLADGRGLAERRAADRPHLARAGGEPAPDWANANATLGKLTGRPARRAGLRRRHGPHAGREPHADRRPPAPDVPRPAHERALLGARAAARVRLPHEPERRPRDLPVLPRPRHAAAAARELGPRERDRRRLPGRDAHAAPRRTPAARARWPRAWTA